MMGLSRLPFALSKKELSEKANAELEKHYGVDVVPQYTGNKWEQIDLSFLTVKALRELIRRLS